jgi:hypothetical protein
LDPLPFDGEWQTAWPAAILSPQSMFLTTLSFVLAAGGGAQSSHPMGAPHDECRELSGSRAEPFGEFVENAGQWPAEMLFLARAGGVDATVLRDGFVLRPLPPFDAAGNALRDTEPLVVRIAGGSDGAAVGGLEPGTARHHFLHARGSARGVRGFARVIFESAWPGVDLVLRRDGDAFAYDLLVAPGADLEVVELELFGATDAVRVGRDLVLGTAEGPLEHRFGAAWEIDEEGVPAAVEPRAVLRGRAADGAIRLGFDVDQRHAGRALVIDPTLSWGTFLGGAGIQQLPRVAVGPDGSIYVALWLFAGGVVPTTAGTPLPTAPGGTDVWVGRLSPDGSSLIWGTHLGGTGSDAAPQGIAVDADGSVVVMGQTFSADFPTTPGVFQPAKLGNSDLYVSRLAPDGSALVWSTYLGCLDSDTPQSTISLFDGGDALVTWGPWTGQVPNLPSMGYDPVYDVGDDLVVRIAADGSSIVAATWLAITRALDTAIDGASNVYLVGDTGSGAPTTPTAHQPAPMPGATGLAGYAASLTPDLGALRYGTYLGGTKNVSVWGAAVDAAGCLYVAAQCIATDSPVTPGAFQPSFPSGQTVGYVAKLLPRGSGLAWATFLGSWSLMGSGYTNDIAVDSGGRATVCGSANGPGWPVTPDALQPVFVGPAANGDAALTQLDVVGEQLEYSTWFGGIGTDYQTQLARGLAGSVALALYSSSPDLHVTPGAYDTSYSGTADVVVAAFDLGSSQWSVLGHGLVGRIETPCLVGLGPCTPASPTRLALRGAAASAPALLVAGKSEVLLPILGGTLVPAPEFVVPVTADALGWVDFSFPWPGLAPGQLVAFQAWILDPGAVQGLSASNGLRAVAQ